MCGVDDGLRIVAVDLFCGAGGLTHGLRQAGVQVAVGVDLDPTCQFAFERNNPSSRFIAADVSSLDSATVASWYPKGAVRVLVGCAPCQPFSKYAVRHGEDDRWRLLHDFLRIAIEVRPDIVSMENVPALKTEGHPAYAEFVEGLALAGYAVRDYVERCVDHGVPQTRQRLVLFAGMSKQAIEFKRPRLKSLATVRRSIGGLPAVSAGKPHKSDALHIAPSLSALNLERIRATPEGGGWHDWPDRLKLECHKRHSGRFYGSVYGRMAWDEPAPTITTQCYGYGNGRFGHPDQDRAITLREAALLQTFPADYKFVPLGAHQTFLGIGRHIGNAVPVAMAKSIGATIKKACSA